MKRKNELMIGMFLALGVLLIGGVLAEGQFNFQGGTFGGGYQASNFQYGGYTSERYLAGQGISLYPGLSDEMCQDREDFLLQVHPLGCSPTVVRSDLLEEQNVPVFCPIISTKINPLIDVNAVDYVSFSSAGGYPEGVAGVGFHPADAALGRTRSAFINSPLFNKIGYAVIVLEQEKNEDNMPDYVEGTLNARLRYDVRNAFGVGDALFYLPEMSDSQWNTEYKKYVFWNGKGYLRAESIGENGAVVGVYTDKDDRISSVNLQRGESEEVRLPGFNCLATLSLSLDDLETPSEKARILAGQDFVEIGVGGTFLENRCRVLNIEKSGLLQFVEIACRDDDEYKRFALTLSPKITLNIDGTEKTVEIGERLFSDNERKLNPLNEGPKDYFLAYVGTRADATWAADLATSSLFVSESPEDLIVYIYEKPVGEEGSQEKMSSEDLYRVSKQVDSVVREVFENIILGDSLASFGAEGTTILRRNIKLIGFSEPENDGGVLDSINVDGEEVQQGVSALDADEREDAAKILDSITETGAVFKWGYIEIKEQSEKIIASSGKPITLKKQNGGFILVQEGRDSINFNSGTVTAFALYSSAPSDLSSEQNDYYLNAMSDYQTIMDHFADAKDESESTDTFGERSYIEAIKLSYSLKQREDTSNLCERFKTLYPKSYVSVEELCNKYKLSNGAVDSAFVTVNGKTNAVSFYGVKVPSVNEFSADILIRKGNTNLGEIMFIRDYTYYFDNGDYIILKELQDKSAKIEYSLTGADGENSDGTAVITRDEPWRKGEVTLVLSEVRLKKVAKVSLTPNVKNTASETNLTFKIGIEKRGIDLSPEKAQKKIKELEDTIKKWEGYSESLGKVVKGFKGACLGVGGFLIVKNFLGNLDGKAIARQEAMRGEGGWMTRCQELAGAEDSQYSSVDDCLLEKSDDIDRDVESIYSAMKNQNEVTEDNLRVELQEARQELGTNVKDPYETNRDLSLERGSALDYGLSEDGYTDGTVRLSQIRDLQRYNAIIGDDSASNDLRVGMTKKRYNLLNDIYGNAEEKQELYNAEEEARNSGLSNVKIPSLKEEKNVIIVPYGDGKVVSKSSLMPGVGVGTSYQAIPYNNDIYYLELEREGNQYVIKNVYNERQKIDTTKSETKEQKDAVEILSKVKVREIDRTYYRNQIVESDRVVRFFDVGPYKGRPAVVPFDTDNGWYVYAESTVSGFGNINAYDDSGEIGSFYLCNVGENGRIQYSEGIGDDICTQFNPGTGQIYGTFPGLDEEDTRDLVDKAKRAVNDASRGYKEGGGGRVNILGERMEIGNPLADVSGMQCQDFMSPKDCWLLFNACDPVICPSSRCDFGGTYRVANVIQSGIVGSLLLCLPNIQEKILVPICLTGVKAGLDSYLSILQNYRDCLQENIDSGETVGICDELHSIYLCEFFWRQSIPLAKMIIPKTFEVLTGQGGRGGGEYLGVQSAWANAEKSVEYFTNYYGANSNVAFNLRNIEDATVSYFCKNSISARYPASADFFDQITEPDSPSQYYAWFSEVPFTSATVPPTSQYKVFYHVYAGKDTGAYYNVYLKSPSQGGSYQIASRYVVDTGYASKGGYASETVDFTAPSGYKELCVEVNGQEECGFKSVTSDVGIDLLRESYISDVAKETSVTSQRECVSGGMNIGSLATNPNLQEGAAEVVNPAIYNRGIIRICSTDNPGKGTDPYIGTEKQRWNDVGYCGEEKIRCWLDTQSVEDTIEYEGYKDDVLTEVQREQMNKWEAMTKDINSFEGVKDEVNGLEPMEIVDLIDEEYLQKAILGWQRAWLLMRRGNAFGSLAKQEYVTEVMKNLVDAEKPEEEGAIEKALVTEISISELRNNIIEVADKRVGQTGEQLCNAANHYTRDKDPRDTSADTENNVNCFTSAVAIYYLADADLGNSVTSGTQEVLANSIEKGDIVDYNGGTHTVIFNEWVDKNAYVAKVYHNPSVDSSSVWGEASKTLNSISKVQKPSGASMSWGETADEAFVGFPEESSDLDLMIEKIKNRKDFYFKSSQRTIFYDDAYFYWSDGQWLVDVLAWGGAKKYPVEKVSKNLVFLNHEVKYVAELIVNNGEIPEQNALEYVDYVSPLFNVQGTENFDMGFKFDKGEWKPHVAGFILPFSVRGQNYPDGLWEIISNVLEDEGVMFVDIDGMGKGVYFNQRGEEIFSSSIPENFYFRKKPASRTKWEYSTPGRDYEDFKDCLEDCPVPLDGLNFIQGTTLIFELSKYETLNEESINSAKEDLKKAGISF